MVCLLAFASLHLGGPMPDRVHFLKQLALVREGDSPEKVQSLLGRPDDVLTEKDPDVGLGGTIWCYGTDGHQTFPTLGQLRFAGKKVGYRWNMRSKPPPSSSVISEVQLRSLLRQLHVTGHPRLPGDDGLWLVRAGNALISAGKDKAIAAIQEYDQVSEPFGNEGLFWLVRTIFDVPADPGYLPRASVGSYFVPKDRQNSPRHPIILMDDVPLSLFDGALLRGAPGRITQELDYFRKNCTLRATPLVPPDDPFVAYAKVLASKLWPFPPFDPAAPTRYAVPFAENEGILLRSLLYLVRTAYRPRDMGTYDSPMINGLDVARYHREFLATGAHWDVERQMYAPRDGRVLLDDTRGFVAAEWKPKLGRSSPHVDLQRRDSENVSYTFSTTMGKGGDTGYFMVIRDASGRPINHSTSDEATLKRMIIIATKHRNLGAGNSSQGSGFSLPEGNSVTVELYYGSEVVRKTMTP